MPMLKEKCYFCDNISEYNDVVKVKIHDYIISGVCKEHLKMGLSS